MAELMAGGTNIGPGRDMRAEVPLVSNVEAGDFSIIDNFSARDKFETVPVSVPVKRHTYALRVHGDSMASDTGDSFPEGSVIVVEPELEAIEGDYVIALNADGETTFKQLVRDGGDYYLRPLNRRYPIKALGTASVVGVVREFSKRFR